MAETEDAARESETVRRILNRWQKPPNVRDVDWEFGEDSAGEPALWIWLIVDDDPQPSAQSITGLNRFVTDIRGDLLRAGLRYWPYVRFRPAS